MQVITLDRPPPGLPVGISRREHERRADGLSLSRMLPTRRVTATLMKPMTAREAGPFDTDPAAQRVAKWPLQLLAEEAVVAMANSSLRAGTVDEMTVLGPECVVAAARQAHLPDHPHPVRRISCRML
jgi:hypothetical protein